jgi:hypothetical protein
MADRRIPLALSRNQVNQLCGLAIHFAGPLFIAVSRLTGATLLRVEQNFHG